MSTVVTGDRHDKRAAMSHSMIAVADTIMICTNVCWLAIYSSFLLCSVCFRSQNYIYYTDVSCVV